MAGFEAGCSRFGFPICQHRHAGCTRQTLQAVPWDVRIATLRTANRKAIDVPRWVLAAHQLSPAITSYHQLTNCFMRCPLQILRVTNVCSWDTLGSISRDFPVTDATIATIYPGQEKKTRKDDNKRKAHRITGWWFGTWILFFHLLGIIIPTDEPIFFRGVGQPPTRLLLTTINHIITIIINHHH